MRVGTGLCYTSFDFRDGIFTQISSELSSDAQREMGLTFTLGHNDSTSVWEKLTGGLSMVEETGNMCGIPLLGIKSGTFKILTLNNPSQWPVVVELTTTVGFIELANEEGYYLNPIYGTRLNGLVARLEIDIRKCGYYYMTYTLPERVYYFGYDPIFKANWAPGYTYISGGHLGPGDAMLYAREP